MIKRIVMLALAVGVMAASGCSVKPDAGVEAVIIRKPLIFGSGGVDVTPVKTGRKLVAPTTSWVYVNMQPQQFTIHFDDLMSSDGVPLDFDSVIRLQTLDSVDLISRFGPGWYANNVEAEFRSRARQAVRKHGMNETAIDTTAIDAIDAEVSTSMVTYLATAGLPVKLIQVTIGKANPPDSIKDQRIQTATQQQRQQTENQRKLAEDNRKLAEVSRAAADNAYRTNMQLTPDQYLKLETIKMQQEACKRGHCTFIVGGSGSNPIPVVEVGK